MRDCTAATPAACSCRAHAAHRHRILGHTQVWGCSETQREHKVSVLHVTERHR